MSPHSDPIDFLQQELASARSMLLSNGVFYRLQTLAGLRAFMEQHVFAVWDFMSLLKALQLELTCVQVPWVPKSAPSARRLINKIVLEEESDLGPDGEPTSYFELYVRAMEECGANTRPIRQLLATLAAGGTVTQALDAAQVPPSVRQFVSTTFAIIHQGRPHVLAGALTFGRKDFIPSIFCETVAKLDNRFPGQISLFLAYLNRQVRLDQGLHLPLAQQLVRELCGDDPQCWQDCQQVALQCLEARMALWDGIEPGKGHRLVK